MAYLCSVFPEMVGRKADSREAKPRKGPAAGSAVRNARMAEGTDKRQQGPLPKSRALSPHAPRRPTPGRDAAVAALRIK